MRNIAIKVESLGKKYIINHEQGNAVGSFCEIYHRGVMIGNKVAYPDSFHSFCWVLS